MPLPEEIELPPSPPIMLGNGNEEHALASPLSALTSPPEIQHRSVSPDLTAFISGSFSTQQTPNSHHQSPMAHAPLRSHTSSGMSVLPPMMQRAYSSPGLDSTGRLIVPPAADQQQRPPSPLGHSSTRRRSPLRSAMEEIYPSGPTWSGLCIGPNIPEHAELDISHSGGLPHAGVSEAELGHTSLSTPYNTIPRSRRTHPMALYHSSSTPNLPRSAANSISASNSPLLNAQRYANEPYPLHPALSFGSGSSMPSTPTSLRSRSPSISSLETIPDTPDAEEAARAEEEEYLKNRASGGEGEEIDGRDVRRRSSLEMRFGGKEKRKRWSVCGAERRGDFSLEVIEE